MKPININTRRELFVDDYLIEEMSGTTHLKLHHPRPQEVVLETDKPWEGNMCNFITVFHQEDRYCMYYKSWSVDLNRSKGDHGSGLKSGPMRVCYAESDDGIHWHRPSVELMEQNAHPGNNIVYEGVDSEQKGSHGFAPFKDPNPKCAEERRYKAVGAELHATKGDLWAASSADGINWTLMSEEPILVQGEDGKFDSQNLAFWDRTRGEYRIYFRDYTDAPEIPPGRCRAIKTATSPDFIHWSEPEWLRYPGAPTEQLYTNQIMPYPRAPHIFVGFPTRYVERTWSPAMENLPEPDHRQRRREVNERFGAALTDGLFMSSRDGRSFRRWGEAFLRPGAQKRGNWAYGDNYQSWGLIETPSALDGAPSEYSFFATENYWRQPTRFRRYSIRKDGFVSCHAPLDTGEIVTKPLRFSGQRLHLNMSTSAAGSVQIEIRDARNRPVDGYTLDDCDPIIGDELDRTVTWKGNGHLQNLPGKPVRLRFVMKDADVYSFVFEDSDLKQENNEA